MENEREREMDSVTQLSRQGMAILLLYKARINQLLVNN